jgi:uncharacterized membrane protein YphA (DoxX/SURF4 family)
LAPLKDSIFARAVAVRLYGLSAIVLGLVGLVWGDFASVWQPVPKSLPGRTALAYAVAAVFLIAGVAMQAKRTVRVSALTLTALYSLGIILLHLPQLATKPSVFVVWSGIAEQLALVAGGLMAYAFCSPSRTENTQRLTKCAQYLFGVCLIFFGLAHFFYLKETAEAVPAWLPPGQVFWAYATAAGHFAAAVAILTGFATRIATMLLTAMFIVFGILVHAPAVFADPHSHFNWAANAVNFALVASAWAIAASYTAPTHNAPAPASPTRKS